MFVGAVVLLNAQAFHIETGASHQVMTLENVLMLSVSARLAVSANSSAAKLVLVSDAVRVLT